MKPALISMVSLAAIAAAQPALAAKKPAYDLLITDAMVYDGSGKTPFAGEVAVKGDRIVYVGPRAPQRSAARTVDVDGQAVAPGFINMLAHPEESLFADGRALSDITQGVTLEVMGEGSMGPLSPEMIRLGQQRQGDIKYPIGWTTLDGYLRTLEKKGIAPNIASFVGAGTVRVNIVGEGKVTPDPVQLGAMQGLVRKAMEDGAFGVTTALIYTPDSYATTPELIALAKTSAQCGGMYIAHIRSEGDRILEAVDETIAIAKGSGGPAEIYHLKQSGRDNWGKLDAVIGKVEAARASGTRITADMYTYTAGATGLDAAMPPWVQEGGLEKWIARLKDPQTRARVAAEMRVKPKDWESAYLAAGPDGTRLLAFKSEKLKPLTGKTLTEVAAMRGVTPEEAAIDLVVEDGSRVEIAYTMMSEDNVRRQTALPWVSFGSDGPAPAPEGVFLKSGAHPRSYGNFARIFAKYVREDKTISVAEAVRKLTSLPAANLSITDRGSLATGKFADIVVFDPATIQDHSTFADPHRLSTGVSYVLINGRFALENGKATGAATGRVVRSRAWTGSKGGGCRKAATDWTWSG